MDDLHSFKIESDGKPSSTRVELNGQDISNLTCGATVKVAIGEIPRIELDLLAVEVTSKTGDAEIYLPQETQDLLVKFGWTPPAEESA